MASHDDSQDVAKVENIKRWSPVWIIPIVTALLGIWIIFYHITTQGESFTLKTGNAEGIIAGKTVIKSRNVDVGIVESVLLSDNLEKVIIKARMYNNMDRLLNVDTVFWVVKPQVGREGISGLGTLLSGAYIELKTSNNPKAKTQNTFDLLDAPPLSSPDDKGIRIKMNSTQPGVLSAGDPVLFRGFKVGTIEASEFDTQARIMRYGLFISAPYNVLVTSNVRFWQESGIDFELSSQGLKIDMPSIDTLFSGGISFDVPEGATLGEPVDDGAEYTLFANRSSIQDSQYLEYKEFLLFFNGSIRGLSKGASVEFRGVRIGTVSEVPFFMPAMTNASESDKLFDYYIPVLVRIEPGRVPQAQEGHFDIISRLINEQNRGLRASLKSANFLTGALYVDFDFYPNEPEWKVPNNTYGYATLPTVSSGLSQLQSKFMDTLDRIDKLPIEPMLTEMTRTLKESQKLIQSLNKIATSSEQLPKDLEGTINELNKTLKGLQPGSDVHNSLVGDLQRFEQVLRELQPLLKTLNEKSNALVFEAPATADPQPRKPTQ